MRGAVKQFVGRELLPLERDYSFDEGRLPDEKRAELTQKVKDAGLFGIYVPAEYGGPGIGFVGRVAMQEEINATLVGYTAFGKPIYEGLYRCNAEQTEEYLIPALWKTKKVRAGITEPISGADPSMMVTYAEERDGKYVINGRKIFISGADKADFLLFYARLKGVDGRAGITCFLPDTDPPGFNVERQIQVLGIPTGSGGELPARCPWRTWRCPRRRSLGSRAKAGTCFRVPWVASDSASAPARWPSPKSVSRWPGTTPAAGLPSASPWRNGRRSSG